MRSYAQYCPIAKASEILGDRWTLLIVREMLGGASGFNELERGLPGISRSVLADRLRSLERAEVVERRTGPKGRTLDYRLTLAGRDLEAVVQAIGEWGVTWSFTDPRPEELDPDLLIVWMARHVDREQLPPGLPPAPRVRRRPRGHGRHRDPVPRLPGARRAGRRAPGSQADHERPEGASARVRTLVRLERVRPCQPAGRRAPQGSVTTRGPPEGAGRATATDASSLHPRGPVTVGLMAQA
jgi:DNA-binding HxlR family transcriptional regulator